MAKIPVTKAYDGSWVCYEEEDIVEACIRAGCDDAAIEQCLELFKDEESEYECSTCFLELCEMKVEDFERRRR